MTDLSQRLPLSWLYTQHNLALRPVVDAAGTVTRPETGTAGDSGADGFTVIQPTELLDPREFLTPGAVVLTVGVALVRETDPFPGYVARLAEAQVSAIGFGIGLFYPEIPRALVDACRDHRVDLFEVPRDTAFIAVLNTVAEERARRARREQERLITVQEQLSTAAVRGGMDTLLTDAASHLAGAVAVTDDDGRVHGRCDRTTRGGVLLSAVEVGRTRTRSSAEERDGVWRITQRMTPQGDRVHVITVVADHPFTPHDRSVLKHAAGLADILLQRPSYLRRARTELNSLALRLRLGLGTSGLSTGQILDQAADGDGRVRPAVVAADRVADLRRALAEIDRSTSGAGRHLFATELDTPTGPGSPTMLFLFRGSRSVEEVAAMVGPARKRVRISVGEPMAWDDVSLERVRRLETAARSLTPGSVVGPYEAGTDWLEDAAVRGALDRRASETVDRLLGAGGTDGATGTGGSGGPKGAGGVREAQGVRDTRGARSTTGRELLQTLEAWLRSGGRTAATAEALGVHRHTVRTRLARIAEILEVDLDDPVVRAELLLVAVTRR